MGVGGLQRGCPSVPKVSLTSNFIRAALCPAGQTKLDFFDMEQRGFLLEVRPTGRKTFYQRYTDAKGRTRQCKVGPAEAIPLDRARQKGREIISAAFVGDDPQQERVELRSMPTLAEFFSDRYMPHAMESKRSWKTDETLSRCHILPALGRLPLDEVTQEKISEVLKRMKDRGKASGTCNRVLILLRYAFNLARKWKVPGARENPTAGLVTAPQVNCDRFLSREEAKRLIGFINSDENRTAANSIMLLLLTGARRNEVTMAKWEFVDWNKHTLLVPLSKSGKPRLVSLNADALALLRSLTPIGGNPYIFPSPLTNVPSPSLFYPFDRMRQRAGLKDVRLHDLRHSFASFLVNRGVPLYTVQGLLGHTQPRTTQRYAHLAPQTLLNAAEAISDALRDEPPEPDES